MLFDSWYQRQGAYDRSQQPLIVLPGVRELGVSGYAFAGNSSAPIPAGRTLRVMLCAPADGQLVPVREIGSIVSTGAERLRIACDFTGIVEGCHWLNIDGAVDFTPMPCPVYVMHGTQALPHDMAPVVVGTHLMQFPARDGVADAAYGMVPARWAPTVVPLAPRQRPAFSVDPERPNLVGEWIVPRRRDDVHRINRTASGVWQCFNTQAYHHHDFKAAVDKMPLLDGPRGQGTICMATHLQPSLRPDSDKLYFCDPWRMGVSDGAGTITTLAGVRDKQPLRHWADAPDTELVGDWSAIPAERRGFNLLWGMAWDQRTLTLDETVPQIDGEAPHQSGPRCFVSDSLRGRVCSIEFSPTDRSAPAKVTEFTTGQAEPWDVVSEGNRLWVSLRQANRIDEIDIDTRAVLRSFPVQAPEGLALMDGMLYVGSRAARMIFKIDLATTEMVNAASSDINWYIDNNSLYIKIAVSDGSFGPRGMIAGVTWSMLQNGAPFLIKPNGRAIDAWLWKGWGGDPNQRRGVPWEDQGYGTAVGIGHGRMVFAGVNEGVFSVSKALPGDTGMPAAYAAGQAKYHQRFLHLLHGPHGFGYTGLPLPWGEDADIDVYLAAHGHTRPTTI